MGHLSVFLTGRDAPMRRPGARAIAAHPWLVPGAMEKGWRKEDVTSLGPAYPEPCGRLEEMRYLDALYERMLPCLAIQLNALHGTGHGVRFWELPMGSWLQVYLHVLRDRFVRLRKAVQAARPGRLVTPAPELPASKIRDYWDFVHEWTMNNRVSMAVYGEIARRMGIAVEPFDPEPRVSKPVFLPHPLPEVPQPSDPPGISHPGGRVLASTLHGPVDAELLRRELGISQYVPGHMEIAWRDIDRNLLADWFEPGDEFEELAASLLPDHLPTSVFEEFEGFCREAEKFAGFDVYHSGSWHSEGMLFRMAAALGVSRGAAITGNQHGGAYGQYASCPTERAERRICDHFASWGWTDEDPLPAKLHPLPQMHLAHLKDSWRPGGAKGLWASNSVPMHTYRIQLYPQDADLYGHYFAQREAFLLELSGAAAEGMRYRPYLWDYGWFEQERAMLAKRPEMIIECQGTLLDAVQSARLFVCDHLGTGMLLALLAGTPTVLFWDGAQTALRPSAEPYFDGLREARILFYDPAEAARHVNTVWNDVGSWWDAAPTREARMRFVERYCLTGTDWLENWKEFFREASGR